MRPILINLLLIFISGLCSAQQDTAASFKNNSDVQGLLKYEKSGALIIHSSGWGIGYRSGKHLTGYKKLMTEFEFVGMKHPKEIKSINPYYQGTRSYVYGKKNVLFLLRPGIGIQKVINEKPYWGGLQVRYFYYGGPSIGLLKPVYLNIIKHSSNPDVATRVIEKYDPSKHNVENIFGKAPFVKGINELKINPGIYGKFGFNFEYGTMQESMKILEFGVVVDYFPKAMSIMAYIPDEHFFISFYLSLQIGNRYNKF